MDASESQPLLRPPPYSVADPGYGTHIPNYTQNGRPEHAQPATIQQARPYEDPVHGSGAPTFSPRYGEEHSDPCLGFCKWLFTVISIALAVTFCLSFYPPFAGKTIGEHHHNGTHSHKPAPETTPCPRGPRPPHRLGLAFNDPPTPGSVYVITEAKTEAALTYSSGGSVKLAQYQPGLPTQRWTCRESGGWLGFTTDISESAVYLGFSPWPFSPTLRCSAIALRFNEMFVVLGRPDAGFRVLMRDGDNLLPLGKDDWGNLARVDVSNIWWGFTKVGRV